MNELQGEKKTGNTNSEAPKDSVVNTAALFGDEKTIEKVFKPFVKTGFPEIDSMLGGGFTPGWVVLGAISNLGKSTFALQLAANIVRNGTPVMFFSFETPTEMIAAKLISRHTYADGGKDPKKAVMAKELVNRSTVRSDAFSPKWDAVKKAVRSISEELRDLYIIDAKSEDQRLTAEAISKRVKAFIKEHKKKPFVIIDYLQIIPMVETKSFSSPMLSIDHNIDVLSKIDKDITVLMISSLNRDSYKEPINLSSFKGSGTIEYSADVILGLDFTALSENPNGFNIDDEKAKVPRKIQLIAIKQRYNASGKDAVVKLDYWSAYDYFEVDRSAQEAGSDGNAGAKMQRSARPAQKDRAGDSGDTVDFFQHCKTKKEVEKLYEKLFLALHPAYLKEDKSGELGKILNAQYDKAMARFAKEKEKAK